jgi:hypothetical protein
VRPRASAYAQPRLHPQRTFSRRRVLEGALGLGINAVSNVVQNVRNDGFFQLVEALATCYALSNRRRRPSADDWNAAAVVAASALQRRRPRNGRRNLASKALAAYYQQRCAALFRH